MGSLDLGQTWTTESSKKLALSFLVLMGLIIGALALMRVVRLSGYLGLSYIAGYVALPMMLGAALSLVFPLAVAALYRASTTLRGYEEHVGAELDCSAHHVCREREARNVVSRARLAREGVGPILRAKIVEREVVEPRVGSNGQEVSVELLTDSKELLRIGDVSHLIVRSAVRETSEHACRVAWARQAEYSQGVARSCSRHGSCASRASWARACEL